MSLGVWVSVSRVEDREQGDEASREPALSESVKPKEKRLQTIINDVCVDMETD
jgi:hypothetical protein